MLEAENSPKGLAEDISHSPVAGGTSKKKSWFFFLKIAISAALIAWILSQAQLAETFKAMAGIRPGWLALAIVLQFIGPALIALRWQGLLAALDVRPGWRLLYVSVLVSTFFRQFLPSVIGGDAIRAYDAWKAGARPAESLMSLLLDRLSGLIALAVFAMLALLFFDEATARIPGIALWLGLGLGAVLLVAAVMLAPDNRVTRRLGALLTKAPGPLARKLASIAEALRLYRGKSGTMLRAFGISLLLQINVVTFYWAIAMGLGLDIGYGAFYVIVPIAIFVMMAPITINGIGLREGIFIFLLGLWSVSEPQALALAWMEYGIFLAFGLLGGVLYALRKGRAAP